MRIRINHLTEKHIRRGFWALVLIFVAGFLFFFSFYQDVIRDRAGCRLREHAAVIADALWRFDVSPAAYLELAARANNYRRILILDDKGKEYARAEGPRPGPMGRMMARAGLFPVIPLETPVQYKDMVIGSIRVDWENRVACLYAYILACQALFLVGAWFFAGLLIARKTLKDRVKERTADLRESQARLQAILDNADAAIFSKDVHGRYITANHRFGRMFNTDCASIIGLTDHDLFPKAQADIYQDHDRQVLAGKTARQFEEAVPDHQGAPRDYVSVKFPLKKADGTVYAICGISTDITEMIKAEQELRQLRNYLSNIIDSMPSVLIGVDREGRITLWNATAARATGSGPEASMGRPLESVYPHLSQWMDRVREAIATGIKIQSRKQVRFRGEARCYEDVTVYPLAADGVEGAVVRIDDVTDQVMMEEMMVQSEKMLSVGGLAAGMAHEINNPLAGMIQTADVMKRRLGNPDIEANRRAAETIGVSLDHLRQYMDARGIFRMIDTINASGARVSEIVDNMLSFARKQDAVVSTHDPVTLMDRILELAATDYDLKKQYDFKDIRIVREYEANLPMLPCQGGKVQQVMLNILRNGAQAMLEGGQDQPCFTLGLFWEKEAGMLRIEIQDNGPGMDREIQKRIFDPFFTTKPPGVGTGLGLSVSYFIITENHGGTMDVWSTPGHGAKFTIRLPLAPSGGSR